MSTRDTGLEKSVFFYVVLIKHNAIHNADVNCNISAHVIFIVIFLRLLYCVVTWRQGILPLLCHIAVR